MLALILALWLEETCAPGGVDGAGAACGVREPRRDAAVGAPAGP
ncbi:hypothetical protein ACQVP2_29295 [Methylobacterium aquaticum]